MSDSAQTDSSLPARRSLCVVPVWNQIEQLPPLLDKMQRSREVTDCFFLVDNGSTDGSTEAIAASGFPWVRLGHNHGIGFALRLGAEKALEEGYQVVANLAGNGKMLPEELPRVIEPVVRGELDYATGSRFLPGGRSPDLPAFRRWAIPTVVNTLVRVMLGVRLTDATCGLRAFDTALLRDPRVKWRRPGMDRYQFEYYLYAKALKLGYRCSEVPCSMMYSAAGKRYSKIVPVVSWWQMMQPWVRVGLGFD